MRPEGISTDIHSGSPQTHSGPPVEWVHRLPRARGVEKDEFLKEIVSGQTVMHVGFWGLTDVGKREFFEDIWLHGELAAAAASVVGLDVDEKGVEEARAAGYSAYAVDCQNPSAVRELNLHADLVVAGELIEHLDSPGRFLDAMHHLGDRLVLTTPNATSLISFATALANREIVNPDHVALYSWYTLTNLLERHGWVVSEVLVYHYQRQKSSRYPGIRGQGRRVATGSIVRMQRRLSKRWPFIDHGLIAVCERRHPDTERGSQTM